MTRQELIKEIHKAFGEQGKPDKGVDNPRHCLACEETNDSYNNFKSRSDLNVNDFNVCYMSAECLNEKALFYLMPKLLELAIIGEENEWDSFVPQVVESLYPDKFGNRLSKYSEEQAKVIILFLTHIREKYYMEKYNIWDDESKIMIEHDYEQRCYENSIKALSFWQGINK